MKFADYPSVQNLVENNIFLLDGPQGTKNITAKHLSDALLAMSGGSTGGSIDLKGLPLADTSDTTSKSRILLANASGENKALEIENAIFSLLDPIISVPMRRTLWRGKNLGSYVTKEQYNEIDAGTFRGIFLGDYWEINERIWRVVDFDYWWGCGDVSCETHHLVIMPDHRLYTGKMNTENNTTGAYVNSAMYKTGLEEAKTIVNGAFTAANVLKHREYLQNAVTSGYASGGAWFDSTVELPNEPMMFGSYINTSAGNGTIIVNRLTTSKIQLAGMRVNPTLLNPHREQQWLRDVASPYHFASVNFEGISDNNNASYPGGVRVVFGLCEDNL